MLRAGPGGTGRRGRVSRTDYNWAAKLPKAAGETPHRPHHREAATGVNIQKGLYPGTHPLFFLLLQKVRSKQARLSQKCRVLLSELTI